MGQNVKVGQGGNEVVLFLHSLEKMLLKLDLPQITSVINSLSFSRKKARAIKEFDYCVHNS